MDFRGWMCRCTAIGLGMGSLCGAQEPAQYNLRVAVDEVSLSFHAADAQGRPVDDLRLAELKLLDNGLPPRRMVDLQVLRDGPIRAGILMDDSVSMAARRTSDRAIAIRYAERVLRKQTDLAFVVQFDALSRTLQPWTNDAAALTQGIENRSMAGAGGGHGAGTAIFDAIYRVCLNEFGHVDSLRQQGREGNGAGSGNFILLFSDGEDNASRATAELALATCQRSHTAIYAFRPRSKAFWDNGAKTLVDLAERSGGRVFQDDEAEADVDNDLRLIEGDQREQYRLVFRPPELKHDGAFHRVELTGPERVGTITAGSGYFAPVR